MVLSSRTTQLTAILNGDGDGLAFACDCMEFVLFSFGKAFGIGWG